MVVTVTTESVRRKWRQALLLAFRERVSETSNTIGLNTRQVTRTLQMEDTDTAELSVFIAKHKDDIPEMTDSEVAAIAQKSVKRKVEPWLTVYVIVLFASLILFNKIAPMLIPILLLLTGIVHCLSRSRARQAKKLWKTHVFSPSAEENIFDKMCETLDGSRVKAANKALLLTLIVLEAALLGAYLLPMLPKPQHVNVANAAKDKQYTEVAEMLGDDAFETLDKAWNETDAGDSARMTLAAAARSVANTDKEKQKAAEYANDILPTFNYKDIALSNFSNSYLLLMKDNTTVSVNEILRQYSKTSDPNISAAIAEAVLNALGRIAAKNDSVDATYDMAKSLNANFAPILRGAFEGIKPEDCLKYADTKDEQHKRDYMSALGALYTDLDDVLKFINIAQGAGVSPAECYPQGAEISVDPIVFTREYTENNDALAPDGNKLLIISRTEKPEPMIGHKTNDFSEDFDGHDKNDPSIYKMKLETVYMNDMPKDILPTSSAECDYVVLLDTYYLLDGVLHSFEYENDDKDNIVSERFYPSYMCVQRVDIIDYRKLLYLWLYDSKLTSSPELPSSDEELLATLNISEYYTAVPDAAWADATLRRHVDELSQYDWNELLLMIGKYIETANQE